MSPLDPDQRHDRLIDNPSTQPHECTEQNRQLGKALIEGRLRTKCIENIQRNDALGAWDIWYKPGAQGASDDE